MTEQPRPGGGPSLTRQTFWFAAAKTTAFVLTSVVPLLLARLLDQTELGLYKQAFLVVASAQRLLTLGFGLSAFYFFPRLRGQERPIVANILFFNLATGLLAWLVLALYPPLLEQLFHSPALLPHAGLIGAVILLWTFSSFIEVAPAAMQETRVSTLLIVAMQVAKMGFMLLAALWSTSLTSLLWSAVVFGLLQSGALLWYLQTRFPGYWQALSAGDFRRQFSYILPLTVAYFIGVASQDIPQYLVASHFGPALYAVFTIGTFQLPLINILHESIGMVLTPTISRLHHEGKHRDIVLVMAAAMRKSAVIAFPIYAGLVVVADEFIILLYTKLYAAAGPIFAINLLLLPLTVFIYEPLVRTFDGIRPLLIWVRAVLLVALTAAVWMGVRQGSMTAAIYAVILAAVLERIAICGRLASLLGLTWRDAPLFADVVKIAAASAAGSAAVALVKPWLTPLPLFALLVICGAVFCLVYVAGVVLLKVPSREEYEWFWRRLGRGSKVDPDGSVPVGSG